MESSRKRYINTGSCRRLQNPISQKFSSEESSTASALEFQTKRVSTSESEGYVGEGSHFSDESSISRVSQQCLLSREKGWGESPCHKFEESQSVYSILTFQNGRFFLPQRSFSERKFNVQTGHEGCTFLST